MELQTFNYENADTTTEHECFTDVDVRGAGAIEFRVTAVLNVADLLFKFETATEEGGTYAEMLIASSHASNEFYRSYGKAGHNILVSEVGGSEISFTFTLVVGPARFLRMTATGGSTISQVVLNPGPTY